MPHKKRKQDKPKPESKAATEHVEDLPVHDSGDEINEGIIFEDAKTTIFELMAADKTKWAGNVKRLFDFSYKQTTELQLEKENIKGINDKLKDIDRKLSFMNTYNEDLQDTISQLKGALEESWKEIDASRIREQNVQDHFHELFENQGRLSKKTTFDLDGDGGGSPDGPMGRYKQIILRERDRLSGELREVERRLVTQRLYGETLEQLCQRLEESNAKLCKEIEAYEVKQLKKGKEIASLKEQIHELTKTKISLLQRGDVLERKTEVLETTLRENVIEMEKLQASFDKLRASHLFFQKKMQAIVKSFKNCVQDKYVQEEAVKVLQQNIKGKEICIIQLTQKFTKLNSEYRTASSRVYKLDRTNESLNQEVAKQKAMVQRSERDIVIQAKNMQNLQRLKELITHERDKLRSEIRKQNTQISDLKNINSLKNNVISNLHMDIGRLNNKIFELRNTISRVEKERDEQAQEAGMLNDKIDALNELIQIKADQITELKTILSEKQSNLTELQQILEKTRSERLVLQMSLQRCTEDRSTLKILQAKTNHQTAQLTEEIIENQNRISNLNLKVDNLEREKQELSAQLYTVKQTLDDTKVDLRNSRKINEKLHRDLEDDEKRFQRVMHQLEETKKDKNLIGLQMVRRNDEISLLRERLSILNITLNRGHSLYNQRLEDIRLLKLKISKLSTEREVLSNAIKNTANMREELARLQRSLNEKSVECSALVDQAKVPVNVHRWRILRGSDPDKYSALIKIRVLQKRIIKLYIEGAQREQDFKNFQKVYDHLKAYIEKIPNQDIKENLVKSQRIIKERETTLKAVTAELNTKILDIKEVECKIDEFNKIMREIKLDLIKVKEENKENSIKKNLSAIISRLPKGIY